MNMKDHVILWSMFISQTFGLFTSENGVFQKTNEVYLSDAYWIVTFVHDLRLFTNYDLSLTNEIIGVITKSYQASNMTGYLEIFKSLHEGVSILTDTCMSIFDSFEDNATLSMNTTSHKRSILPICGKLMHTFIGTLSEKDL